MLYSYIVKKKIRQTFDDVNNHRWDEAVAAVAPQVHHRVSGIHALAGERNDKEALRCWFQRLGRVQPNLHLRINNIWVNGWPGNTTVFVQWDGTATLLNGERTSTVVSTCLPCGGAESIDSRNFKTPKQRPMLSPHRRQLDSKKLSLTKL